MDNATITVPDLGSDDAVEVIEVMIVEGQVVATDDPLITIESDKATFEVPAEQAGTITAVKVKLGDKVKTGDVIAEIGDAAQGDDAASSSSSADASMADSPPAQDKTAGKTTGKTNNKTQNVSASGQTSPSVSNVQASNAQAPGQASASGPAEPNAAVNASPQVRKAARELGVDLAHVTASVEHGRITLQDVQQFVQEQLSSLDDAAVKPEDASRFGAVETTPLSKVRAMTAAAVHRSWLEAPLVTHFDEADISDLEDYRKRQKLSFLPFLLKAVANTLEEFPLMRSSLDIPNGELVQKNYYRIGLAVNTEQGLLRPVLADVDQQNIAQLTQSLKTLVKNARAGKLSPADQRGAVFTISSLGAAGGTQFTPIVNSPEVGILGVSKTQVKPVYAAGEFVPATMLPLALSYDHRVIDGVYAAEFMRALIERLEQMAELLA